MRHLRMLHISSVCACLITLTLLTIRPETANGANVFTYAQCLRAIDKLVMHVEQVDTDTAQQGLSTLAHSCEEVPQVHHNLGVIAARQGQWETAISSFQRAIALNPQTADTVKQLSDIHEFQAKKAWRVALELEQELREPLFTWQDSSDENRQISANAANIAGLRSVATVDFELYNWWHAWDATATAEWSEYYVNGYPPPTFDEPRPVSWDEVEKDIQFTASDAAVVLKWTQDGSARHRWLLLTLTGQRWKIYHESAL